MYNDDWGIECLGLSRSFGLREVLSDVNLRISRGSLVALVGSNGAGKTTLMKILTTLLAPTRGVAKVLGKEVTAFPMACRRSIGYAPADERSFHGRLSVIQNLEFFSALQGVSSSDFRTRAGVLLETLGLEKHGQTRFAELSSGMKQTLSMIRSLLHDPPVLLLDEPTRSLSPDLAHRVWALLHQLAHDQGKTILLATHSLREAEAVADEMAILHRGRLVAQGSPAQICLDHAIDGSSSAEALFLHLTRESHGAVAP